MKPSLDETHDPELRSWVESANDPESDFCIQNLPYGVFRRKGSGESPRVGIAIGDCVFDISEARDLRDREGAPLFSGRGLAAAHACRHSSLNALMALGPDSWRELRRCASSLLRQDGEDEILLQWLVPQSDAEVFLPARVGDYTDFYASIHHATNVGSMFRPDNPLMPNYKHLPVGYHGRSSSLVVSGTPVRRPRGQVLAADDTAPSYGPSRLLDYELEVGFFIGPGNNLGEALPIGQASSHIFGLCLVNDWSARDIQKWEYQPLGPFLGKSFATTLSPWVVTLDALAPYRTEASWRPSGDPPLLPHLSCPQDAESGAIDIALEVFLCSRRMREEKMGPHRLSRSNFRDMYWTIAQMLTHHASNGCNLRPGDLMASGTVSGTEIESRGCLLELTWRGSQPIELPSGESRRFLEDGDEVILKAACSKYGQGRIGFGECRGIVVEAES